MSNMITKTRIALLVAAACSPLAAYATNGMNLQGYGPIAGAMGGASMAYDNGTAALMNNPATLGLMNEGNRLDIAFGRLAPDVSASDSSGSASSSGGPYNMPAIGYVNRTGNFTTGIGVFAQGGMGTEYSANSFLAYGSGDKVRSEVGVGRAMIPFVFNVNPNLVIGGSFDYVFASMDLKMALSGSQFSDMIKSGIIQGSQTLGIASGNMVDGFAALVPGTITAVHWGRFDFSNDNPFSGMAKGDGTAAKLGFVYKVDPKLTIGGSYHSKTSLGDMRTTTATVSFNVDFNGGPAGVTIPVAGSIAIRNFQWPETIGLGLAYQASPDLMIVADYKRIGWAAVMKNFNMTFTASTSQPNAMAAGFAGATLDATLYQNWSDQNVFEVGGAYKMNSALTVRAGVNIANNPVPDQYVNALFPAIFKSHYDIGLGYALSQSSDLNFSYVYTPKVSGTNSDPTGPVTSEVGGYEIQMMYSSKF